MGPSAASPNHRELGGKDVSDELRNLESLGKEGMPSIIFRKTQNKIRTVPSWSGSSRLLRAGLRECLYDPMNARRRGPGVPDEAATLAHAGCGLRTCTKPR